MKPGRLASTALAVVFLSMIVPARAATIEITMENLVISPAEVSAKVGDTITWVNQDTVPHTVTARDKSFNLAVDRGAHAQMTLSKAGNFLFYCLYHPMMRGALKVAP